MGNNILFITPPFSQLNTPYPATAYLKGFLNTRNIPSNQADLGLEVILALFSSKGFTALFAEIKHHKNTLSANARRIINLQKEYIKTIDSVISFLQDNNPSLGLLICEGSYLPEASRFGQATDLEWAFGAMGTRDKAKHLATLYLEDISDLIIEAVDPHFGFSRYAEKLGSSASTFDELDKALNNPESLIDNILLDLLKDKIEFYKPGIIALSVPFPGNVYSALKCGQWVKKHHPEIKIVIGGGYPNTELRSLSDPRVFNYVDFITLDDGEAPLLHLLEHFKGKRTIKELKRTFTTENDVARYFDGSKESDFRQEEVGTPDYSDLLLNKYISVIELANPMHRLWSDGRWNKLTLAHGCYWGKCTFCDVSLDYIRRYEPNSATLICDRIEELIRQTGESGFHFVDEAAPPTLLRELALEIIRRNLSVAWWTNIRFEKNFTFDLCRLLKESGCIAVSGGLEVASDRLLKLINKGVSVEQVARVADNFTRAGIMVHAYLMYGFPTQTAQETIDSLEIVRQLFSNGLLQSAFWHQFAMTAHSPVGLNPQQFKVEYTSDVTGTFANNEIEFSDKHGCDHEAFGEGLRKSLYNYMHGIAFDMKLSEWFGFYVPHTSILPEAISQAIEAQPYIASKPDAKIIWTGSDAELKFFEKNKKGKSMPMAELLFDTKKHRFVIQLQKSWGEWLFGMMPVLAVKNQKIFTYHQLEQDFDNHFPGDFPLFWNSPALNKLRGNGLLII